MKVPGSIIWVALFAGVMLISSCEKEDKNINDDSNLNDDGNTYASVSIGNQVWMKENLKTTKYNDGTAISEITENNDWKTFGIGAGYCWYQNDQSTYKDKYGALYNWEAVNSNKLCPVGWHVPSDTEWQQLQAFLSQNGHHNEEGTALKTTAEWTDQWGNPLGQGTDNYGFSAYPAGARTETGAFTNKGMSSTWWTSNEFSDAAAISYGVSAYNNFLSKGSSSKSFGRSVRCIKD
jgi:uncharacterized protein (TIGR02145 family)